ncbi:MAG: GNAT family N-acetyltransferase, partial [Sedimentisphaerales bacterium]|nr:GNAT family N-acetyltransferase [Sedimentisphaerales bacterium]
VFACAWEDGTRALFPVLKSRQLGGLACGYQSGPAGCYGGWLCRNGLSAERVGQMTAWIRARFDNLVWRINPFAGECASGGAATGLRPDSTEVICLEEYADPDACLCRYRPSVRNKIHKAQRAGLRVRPADRLADWRAYYRLYEQALVRWGPRAGSRYGWELFRLLYEQCGRAEIRLWVVTDRDDRIAGGNLNFYFGRHCVEWHAAFDEAYFSRGVRNFLVHHLIQDAQRRGCRWYDFNPSGPHDGTRRFKQAFGTRSLPAPVWVRQEISLPLRVLQQARRVAGGLKRRVFVATE